MDGVSAVITAGGQSSRFGTDKALARLHGRTLLEHVAASLEECKNRLLIAPAGKYALSGWTVIPDLRPGQGPLAGLETALTHAPPGWVAFAGADMPFLTPEYWQTLAQARTPEALAVQAVNAGGRPQPLAALYHTDLLGRVTELLDGGERRLRVAALPERAIQVTGLDGWLRNVNTPADLPQ